MSPERLLVNHVDVNIPDALFPYMDVPVEASLTTAPCPTPFALFQSNVLGTNWFPRSARGFLSLFSLLPLSRSPPPSIRASPGFPPPGGVLLLGALLSLWHGLALAIN